MGSSEKCVAADRQRGEPCFIFFSVEKNAAERAAGRLGDDQIKMLARRMGTKEKNDEGDNLEAQRTYHPLSFSLLKLSWKNYFLMKRGRRKNRR